jgi:hypothetical protein
MAVQPLNVWTVYYNPADFPDKYVARRFECKGPDGPFATEDMRLADSLAEIRNLIPPGLYRMEPWQGDDPCIVETWI